MREASRVLMAFERAAGGSTEGLMFVVNPGTSDLVVQAVVSERMLLFPIPGGDALELAHAILSHFAPAEMEVLERSAHRARLSLVTGGAGPAAA